MLPNLSHSSSSTMVHVPVMPVEVADLLEPRPGDTVVDCTFGAGGHAGRLEPLLRGSGTYVAIDRDASVAPFYERFAASATATTRFVGGDFGLVLRNMASTGARAEAILMDLGTSSMQVDTAARGFSYASDAPLDMRMDTSSPLTAAEIVNTWDEREIAEILASYGEERYARQIARAVVRRRASRPIERSADLVEIIRSAIPTPARFGQGHPAKRVFQALRIATNDELQSLRDGLEAALDVLTPGGRIAVISFHSLEDRIVKRFIRDAARGCTCPPDFPVCVCGHQPVLRSLTARAVVPSVEERCENPRSASAKLRAAERTQAP
jgi:16S rRNA (cytosine1402-N4)-methyltransferase